MPGIYSFSGVENKSLQHPELPHIFVTWHQILCPDASQFFHFLDPTTEMCSKLSIYNLKMLKIHFLIKKWCIDQYSRQKCNINRFTFKNPQFGPPLATFAVYWLIWCSTSQLRWGNSECWCLQSTTWLHVMAKNSSQLWCCCLQNLMHMVISMH